MIDGIPLSDLTPVGLLLVAVLLIFLGWLVPKRTHDDVKKQRDTWQKAAETEQAHNRTTDEALALIVDMLKSIKRAGTGGDSP